MFLIKLAVITVIGALVTTVSGQELSVSAEEVSSLIESCCNIGSSRAKNLPTMSCDTSGRSLEPLLQGQSDSVTVQCTMTARMCCSRQLKATACELGKETAKVDGDCNLTDNLSAAKDTFTSCCEACKMGTIAAKSGRGCKLDFGFGMPADGSYQACCTKALDSSAETSGGSRSRKRKKQQRTGKEDKCQSSRNMCEQRCVDPGDNQEVRCECFTGYQLASNGHRCEDLNECLAPGACPVDSDCVNFIGGFECLKTSDLTAEMTSIEVSTEAPEMPRSRSRNSADKITPYELPYRQPASNERDRGRYASPDQGPRTQAPVQRPPSQDGPMSVPIADDGGCPPGYLLDIASRMCQDVNECDSDNLCAVPFEDCINLPGRYTCEPPANPPPISMLPPTTMAPVQPSIDLCAAGLRKSSNGRCMDINECLIGQHDCSPGIQICENTIGSYSCIPISGAGFGDETANSVARAQSEGCPAGFDLGPRGHCEDQNECELWKPCLVDQSCTNRPGGYSCHCLKGYELDMETRQCKDLNECQLNPDICPQTYRCDNTIGSFVCTREQTCGTGYTFNTDLRKCEDDDECALNRHNCGQGFVCRNNVGSFRCERPSCPAGQHSLRNGTCMTNCGPGYRFDQRYERCDDIDECTSNPNVCSNNEQCVNTAGGFQCRSLVSCEVGFEYNSQLAGCEDIDECTTGGHDCTYDQTCRNTPGAYVCTCPMGFVLNGRRECEDIDECSRWSNICPDSSVCLNTVGSYECSCKTGFKQDARQNTCADIDECDEGVAKCSQKCVNTYGSYMCACNLGFTLAQDQMNCDDVDECHMYSSERTSNGTGKRRNTYSLCGGYCVNVPGSYRCDCPPGYTMSADMKTCLDIDECELNRPCQQEEICLNTKGSHKCYSIKCPDGYFIDPIRKNRCIRPRTLRACEASEDDSDCAQQLKAPLSYSYNFLTFSSNVKIPRSGHLDLFTMRGPRYPDTTVMFDLRLVSATSDRLAPEVLASRNVFGLRTTAINEAMISAVRTIPGPQDIQLELVVRIFASGQFGGTSKALIFVHVSENEF